MVKEKIKLKIDPEDLLLDTFSLYKDPDFDIKKKLRVQYLDQQAADTGGVMRQYFTDVLSEISVKYFEGNEFKLPVYNASVLATGLMKYIGYIVVHSILQGGPGLLIFSIDVYNYIVNGEVEQTINKISIDDCSMRMRDFNTRVCKVSKF